jgi:hypothetical protein
MKDDTVRLTTAERRSFGSLLESMERWQSATMAPAGEFCSRREPIRTSVTARLGRLLADSTRGLLLGLGFDGRWHGARG